MSGSITTPAVILAADHRARGVMTTEHYGSLVVALARALPHCEGILASVQPLGDLVTAGAVEARHRTYLSVNRTGLAGSAFELDDRLVVPVARAAELGYSGIKHMTRIDPGDASGAAALELLGQVLDEARHHDLEALVEIAYWHEGRMVDEAAAVARAAAIAHDNGAPLLKVPVPAAEAGPARRRAVERVVGAVGVPVLFLGGPADGDDGRVLAEVADVMAGGGAGMAIGRTVYQHTDPAEMAARVAEVVHG